MEKWALRWSPLTIIYYRLSIIRRLGGPHMMLRPGHVLTVPAEIGHAGRAHPPRRLGAAHAFLHFMEPAELMSVALPAALGTIEAHKPARMRRGRWCENCAHVRVPPSRAVPVPTFRKTPRRAGSGKRSRGGLRRRSAFPRRQPLQTRRGGLRGSDQCGTAR